MYQGFCLYVYHTNCHVTILHRREHRLLIATDQLNHRNLRPVATPGQTPGILKIGPCSMYTRCFKSFPFLVYAWSR